MTELPTIRSCDVSPHSPYLIRAGSSFVVGRLDSEGYIMVFSQHRSEQAADDRRYRDYRYTPDVRVYRVER